MTEKIKKYEQNNNNYWTEEEKGNWCKYEDVEQLEEENEELRNHVCEHACCGVCDIPLTEKEEELQAENERLKQEISELQKDYQHISRISISQADEITELEKALELSCTYDDETRNFDCTYIDYNEIKRLKKQARKEVTND